MTPSMRIRTARTTRWSACAAPRGCSARATRPFLAACYAATLALLALAGRQAGLGAPFYLALILPAALLARQVVRLDIDDPGLCLRLFNSNRDAGLAVALAVLLGPAVTDAGGVHPRQHRRSRALLAPEIPLYLATEITPIWQATEVWLRRAGVEPPFWAFAWPGSEALARYVLDHPHAVAGRRVLDFAAGCGLAAIACARAGAASVEAADIDPLAAAAIRLNAGANGVVVTALDRDVVGQDCRWDVILCGDVCYEAPMTRHILPWLRGMARRAQVWIADPGRAYVPPDGAEAVARYAVPTTMELEDRLERVVTLFRLATRAPAAGR